MEKNQILKIFGTDYKEMTKRLLHEADLRALLPGTEKCIGIKPNLVSPSEASCGATTHPEVVAGIIEYLQEYGYHRIMIAEGSWVGDRTADAVAVCSYDVLAEQYGVIFHDAQKDKSHPVDCAGLELNVCDCVDQMDFLINVPVLKGHCQTKITCALKNMKGLLPNSEKRRFHAMGLHKPIAHLSAGIHQDFIVVDHICGDLDFEDGGNPVVRNCVMAARDPVLVDAYVCYLLHYRTAEVPYVGMAAELGIGCADLGCAEIWICGREENCPSPAEPRRSEAADYCSEESEDGACAGSSDDRKNILGAGGLHGCENAVEAGGPHGCESAAGAERLLWQAGEELPYAQKVVAVRDFVEEVESCSACYGYLIPALDRLRSEGLLDRLHTKICIGQGYRGSEGELGIGQCTAKFAHTVKGCPPTETQIYEFLKGYLLEQTDNAKTN